MSKNEIFEAHLENNHPNFLHLLYSLPIGIIIFLIRFFFLRCIFKPLGKYFGIKDELITAPKNEILEKIFYTGNVDNTMITKLSRQLHMSKKEVREWLRLRLIQEEQPDLLIFCQSSWRCFFATCSFTYGLFIFWNKPWLWNIKECFYDHPFHVITNDMWWYYMVSITYNLTGCINHYFNINTKNFAEFFFHNIVLLVYLCLAWYANLVRLGILIIIGMAIGDIILEVKKIIHCTTYHMCRVFLNVILVLLWVLARNYIFPLYVVYGSFAAGYEIIQITPTIIIMYFLLVIIVFMDGIRSIFYIGLSI